MTHTESKSTSISIIFASISRYMVDAADHEKLDQTRSELHSLLEKPQLAGIPVRISHFITVQLNETFSFISDGISSILQASVDELLLLASFN